jgi:hypothetical protein
LSLRPEELRDILTGMLIYLIFVFVVSYCFANLEIQIEGTAGWAKNLPTWRIENHWMLKIFWGGRPLTGYHFWAMIFIFFLFHMPFFFSSYWTLKGELQALGGLILFWVIEDFLWFVLNPGYGIRKFNKSHIPWHPRWILGMPVDYWIFWPLGLGFLYFSTLQ